MAESSSAIATITRRTDARVLEVAQRLREDGVDCTIDRYIAAPAQGWPRWNAKK